MKEYTKLKFKGKHYKTKSSNRFDYKGNQKQLSVCDYPVDHGSSARSADMSGLKSSAVWTRVDSYCAVGSGGFVDHRVVSPGTIVDDWRKLVGSLFVLVTVLRLPIQMPIEKFVWQW